MFLFIYNHHYSNIRGMKLSKNTQRNALIALGSLFFINLAWWLLIPVIWPDTEKGTGVYLYFAATYGLVTIVGGVAGLIASRHWGGLKSYLGKALFFLSLGLLLTEFGQLAFSYFTTFRDVELPYPSIADIGFFGAIPMYVLGSFYLLKTLNIKSVIKNAGTLKLIGLLLIPIALMVITYLVNFKDYSAEDQGSLVIFLDFADPIGHLIYLSFTLLALTRAQSLMGGMLRKGLIIILIGFLAQYLADMNFLYQELNETWVNGGYGDALYLLAYSIMALGLISFCSAHLLPKTEGAE